MSVLTERKTPSDTNFLMWTGSKYRPFPLSLPTVWTTQDNNVSETNMRTKDPVDDNRGATGN